MRLKITLDKSTSSKLGNSLFSSEQLLSSSINPLPRFTFSKVAPENTPEITSKLVISDSIKCAPVRFAPSKLAPRKQMRLKITSDKSVSLKEGN